MDKESVVLKFPISANSNADLRAILSIIGREIAVKLTWVVGDLDCTGVSEFVQQFCNEVKAAPQRQVMVQGRQVLQLVDEVMQIIDGTFIGFRSTDLAKLYLKDSGARTLAEYEFWISDSTSFEVNLAERSLAQQLVEKLNLQSATITSVNTQATLNYTKLASDIQELDAYPPLTDPKLYDTVRSAVEKLEVGLCKGALGTIVLIHDRPEEAFEVEFINDDGSTQCICAMTRDELRANK